MKFQIREMASGKIQFWFKSSKEEFYLGELSFQDSDGEMRPDVKDLLLMVLQTADIPFFEISRLKKMEKI